MLLRDETFDGLDPVMREAFRKVISQETWDRGMVTELALLKRSPGAVVSREETLTGVWELPEAVDMCVDRLCRKIVTDRVRTVYGKGYMPVVKKDTMIRQELPLR